VGHDREVSLAIPPLPGNTVLVVEVGSTAHGTGLPGGEDHDEIAVVIEAPVDVLGLNEQGMRSVMQRTQPEGSRSGPGDTDRTLYSLRRFVRLAASGNPSILMCFWAPVMSSTEDGWELRALGDAFIGRHVIPRYRGYMQAQAERLVGVRGSAHGKRGGGQREELVSEHGYDTKFAMHCARLGFQGPRAAQCRVPAAPYRWRAGRLAPRRPPRRRALRRMVGAVARPRCQARSNGG